jgi:hypothetical protein
MSCPNWEERIAEESGGGFSADVREHLNSCAECALLAEALERDRLAIASAPFEAADADYAAMRHSIRAAIVRRRRARRYVPALLAAAALAGAFVVTHRSQPPARPVVADRQPVVESTPPAAAQAAAPVQKPSRKRRPPQAASHLALLERAIADQTPPDAGSQSPIEMRIETANPNVTIILLQEKDGSYE